jgi:hypothetical protein
METLTRKSKKPTFREVLDAARELSPTEQLRLRDELTKLVDIYVMIPDNSPEAIERGRQLAEQARAEVNQSMKGTLEEMIASLRGRSWS